MVSGHLNPGYGRIVTRCSLAVNNPEASPDHHQKQQLVDRAILDDIRARAAQAWSRKDESETTYGFYFSDPALAIKNSRPNVRPTSPTRRNNPHPKEYKFLFQFLKTTVENYLNLFKSVYDVAHASNPGLFQ